MLKRYMHALTIFFVACILIACGFKPQGSMPLAPPLHSLSISSVRPYGDLTSYLKEYLKTSGVKLSAPGEKSQTTLFISQDDNTQTLTGFSNTQQTRQYNLTVTVTFAITNNSGLTIVAPQTLSETRPITIQADQILGSSNEATLYYQQMRRQLASSIMNRLTSKSVTRLVNQAFDTKGKKAKS